MPRSRRHHYLPQFHQRLFGAGLDGARIWVYDKHSDEIFMRQIKDTAVIGNYYTITTEQGPDDALEKLFARIEGAAAPVMRDLCDETGPRFAVDVASRMALATYLALLYGRVPSHRLAAREMLEFGASVMLDMNLSRSEGFAERARAAGMDGTDEELEAARIELLEGLRAKKFAVRAPEESTLGTVVDMMRAVTPYITATGWWLLKRSTFPHYIVGDDPVTVWPARNHPEFLGVGFATHDAEVSVPLNSETMLVMGHNVPDGYVWEEESIPGVRIWLPSWPYHYRQWSKARRFVFGQSRADLQAIQFTLMPEERQRPGGGLVMRGGPAEWQAYGPGA